MFSFTLREIRELLYSVHEKKKQIMRQSNIEHDKKIFIVTIDNCLIVLYERLFADIANRYLKYIEKHSYNIKSKELLHVVDNKLQDLSLYFDDIITFGNDILTLPLKKILIDFQKSKKTVDNIILKNDSSPNSLEIFKSFVELQVKLLELIQIEIKKINLLELEREKKTQKIKKENIKEEWLNPNKILLITINFFTLFYCDINKNHCTNEYLILFFRLVRLLTKMEQRDIHSQSMKTLCVDITACCNRMASFSEQSKHNIKTFIDQLKSLPIDNACFTSSAEEDNKTNQLNRRALEEQSPILSASSLSKIHILIEKITTQDSHVDYELKNPYKKIALHKIVDKKFNTSQSALDAYCFDLHVKFIVSGYLFFMLCELIYTVLSYSDEKNLVKRQYKLPIIVFSIMLVIEDIKECVDAKDKETCSNFLSFLDDLRKAHETKSYLIEYDFVPVITQKVCAFHYSFLLDITLSRFEFNSNPRIDTLHCPNK